MEEQDLTLLLERLILSHQKTEWVFFKHSDYEPQLIGQAISAIANAASYHKEKFGYIIFGIDGDTMQVLGTSANPSIKRLNSQTLIDYLNAFLQPKTTFKFHEFIYKAKEVVILKVEAAKKIPVNFKEVPYIRVNHQIDELTAFPERAWKMMVSENNFDWSAQICDEADITDLAPEAIKLARYEYKKRHQRIADEVDTWNDSQFLDKARITASGKITNAAIILLGKPESEKFIAPSVAKISYVLKEKNSTNEEYLHVSPPLILGTREILHKITNVKYTYPLNNELFPTEIMKYDTKVIREALHNCIAHQDYKLNGRINIMEYNDELVFINLGTFIPKSVDTIIEQDTPPEVYRNLFLTHAMVNINMGEAIGSGIRKMFTIQKERFFPLPQYRIERDRVRVRIYGKVLDINYTKMLTQRSEIDLKTAILLDRVQKREYISRDEHTSLKKKGFVEGRYPTVYISEQVAKLTNDKISYIKNRGFNKQYYMNLICEFLKKYHEAGKRDIYNLLIDKLSDVLTQKQKENKIKNLMSEMTRQGMIKNIGIRSKPLYRLGKVEVEG